MKMYFTLRVLLALHITGIVIMAGTTMIDYLTFKTFWKFADQGDVRSLGLIPLMAKYGAFIRAGAGTIILTGITMLILQKGVWWGQPWFKVKMILVVLLVLNGLLVGNKQGHKLREMVTAHTSDFMQYTMGIRESMNRFYPIQLALFFLIILISIIRLDKIGS
jgi:hypothetical protein